MTTADSSRASTLDPMHALTAYHWEPQPKAAAYLDGLMNDALGRNAWLRDFADRLYQQSGNRITDLVRLWIIKDTPDTREQLEAAGWEESDKPGDGPVFVNRSGMFADVMLAADSDETDLGLKIDSAADFAATHALQSKIHGQPGSPLRYVLASSENGLNVYGMESRGHRGWLLPDEFPSMQRQHEVLESFRTRDRSDTDDAFDKMDQMVDTAIEKVGRDLACDLWFWAEREFWQRRNKAARFQFERQNALGIGWANHDHHTYRSSRRHFHRLVSLWEKLGLECRERFYPGPEAGWGAQVMEHPVCGIVTFNDVDISPDELKSDFAHDPMTEDDSLATVGLWCALHGESVLGAGMHHLECTFDFVALRDQMADSGIQTMKPFTDFAYLKQAFTAGERWAVADDRIAKLEQLGLITPEQADDFRQNGAVGSHLENLERNDGFKGFNQTGVTQIIKETDPRLVKA